MRRGTVEKICKVESTEIGCNTLYMKLEGIDSPEDVRKYTGWELVVSRKYAHPLQKNEWYIEDLKNCSLIWKDGSAAKTAPTEIVGTITDVLEGGAGYLLEVSISESCNCISEELKKTSSGKPRTVLIPFNNEHVGKVDVKKGTIQLMHLWILE